jgi:hypothetical protein
VRANSSLGFDEPVAVGLQWSHVSDAESKSESEPKPPSAEESGVTDPASAAETDAGWDALVGESEEITAPVTPAAKPPVSARPPAPLFTPSVPGAGSSAGPKVPPAPTLSGAPPVPGIKPTPLFTPVTPPTPSAESSDEAEADDGAAAAEEADDADTGDSEDSATDRAPVRLPTPGVWGKQAPHDAVIDFARREDKDDFLAKASASAAEDDGAHAPDEIQPQDTQALIASMAEEIEDFAEEQKAAEEAERARAAKEAALLEQPTIVYDKKKHRAAGESDSKMGWIGIAAAAFAGVVLIGWSIAGGDDAAEAKQAEAADASAAVAAAERPNPSQPAEPEPEPQAAPVPVPVPVPVPEEAAGETGAEEAEMVEEEEVVEEPAPAPEPAATSTKKQPRGSSKKSESSKKSAPATTSSSSGPKASSKPKSPPSKSAADLLRDAKKANASGKASKAYSLANQSYQKKSSSSAAEVMVLAACKMKNKGKARTALSKVKLLKRRDLKQRCKSLGVKL